MKAILQGIGAIFVGIINIFRSISSRIVNWSRLHIPFIEALFQRHLKNPAMIFVDLAVLIIVLYISFGITGATLIYAKSSESRFSETLATLYPLPAAKVDSTYIWSHKFLQRLRFLNTFSAQAPKSVDSRPPTDSELRKQVLEGLVEDQIILITAKEFAVSVSEAELDSAYNAQKSQTKDFVNQIKMLYGMSVSDFRAVLAERILKEKVKNTVLTKVKVRHILINGPVEIARQAIEELKQKKAFGDVAKKYSQDLKTKNKGGELGSWTKGELALQISQSFEDAAFKLAVNAISEPVYSRFGFHIIQVTEKTGNNYQTYDEWYAETLKKHQIKYYIGY
ncbi:peptidylprolyl isomerase [Candidatus Berkelbacteria bacterium]|nr:peptidylprolyl isomerase [Candidatus Berkelbacteria bacterium]